MQADYVTDLLKEKSVGAAGDMKLLLVDWSSGGGTGVKGSVWLKLRSLELRKERRGATSSLPCRGKGRVGWGHFCDAGRWSRDENTVDETKKPRVP